MELYEQAVEIMEHFYHLHDVSLIVSELHDNCMENPTDDNIELFEENYKNYEKLLNKIKILLEAYFAEEAKEQAPIDIHFRKAYKKITGSLD